MPFTPFHMGAALAIKPGAQHHFSLIAFGLAQIAMDIEPLLGMILGWDRLHGPTHTFIGALCIAPIAAWLAPLLYRAVMPRINQELHHYGLRWLMQPALPSRAAVWAGALVGTVSHVVLDSLMHHDMTPLAPFSAVNPLLGWVEHDSVYRWCALAGGVGAVVWCWQLWRKRRAHNA